MSDLVDRIRAALAERYTIEREIGAGGMATVYLAVDVRHHRKVAVKVLRSELAATMGPDRFLREIEIAARLQHPHVLPLYDSGDADGFLYYVMPFVEGESLRAKLDREGELPVRDAVRILRDVADALAYAHERGVVHRDVKPANVLLSGRHAMVSDFGVAKAVSEATGRQQMTTAGVALGTPHYMAPEQAAADPNVDHRADIYAFGALAYEVLTGRPPFSGRTSQMVLAAHVTETPVDVTEHRASVPPELSGVVMRCLQKKPADRWQSAEQLIPQLEGLATPSGGMTPTETRPLSTVETGARRRTGLTLAAVAALVALAVWGLSSLGSPGPAASNAADAVALSEDRVLVGVFVNETGDPAHDPVGRIVADWLTRGLHETGLIEVVDERGVGSEPTPGGTSPVVLRELASDVGAGFIVSGSYYLTGDSLEIQGQVLDAATGSIVRAVGPMTGTPDAPQAAIGELRDRFMGAFANILDPRFGAIAPGISPPSYEAYEAFIAGDELFYVQGRYQEAAERLMDAYRLDTTFTVAAVRAAVALNNAGRCDSVDSIATFLNAKRQSVVPFDRYYLDRIQARCLADFPEHLRAAEEMMRVAPRSPFATYLAGRSALWVNRVRYGLELMESIDPSQGEIRQSAHQLVRDIASGYHQLGEYAHELEVVEGFDGWSDNDDLQFAFIRALAALGRSEDALRAAEAAAARSLGGGDHWPSDVVCHAAEEIHAHSGADASRTAREACLASLDRRGVTGSAAGDSIAFLLRRGEARYRLGRLDEARSDFAAALRIIPDGAPTSTAPESLRAIGRLGVIAARQGDAAASARWDERLRTYESPYVGGSPTLWRARIALAREQPDRALDLLRQAFNEGVNFWVADHGDRLHADVDLEPLFDDPEYRALVALKD